MLLSLVGGIIGCLLVLPLNNIDTALGNFITFSETVVQLSCNTGHHVMGVIFAVFLGAIGGYFPARMAAKKEILTALREI